MNLEQLTEIRTSIDNAIAHLRCDCHEDIRTALQTHLDALLKEELRALTGQALEGDLVAEYVQAELGRVKGALQRDDAPGRAWVDPRKDSEPTPWYPYASGDWVEVPKGSKSRPAPLASDTRVYTLGTRERQEKHWSGTSSGAADDWDWATIVAYKVVKP